MWHYPVFDPVAIQLGPISIHWYAISYLVGIGLAWWALGVRSKQLKKNWPKRMQWSDEAISDVIFYAMLGIIFGGRIGYLLFYGSLDYILANPLVIVKVWQGGMSFHGGMIGVFISMWFYGRKTSRGFFDITDFIAPVVPLGLGSGRIGNFINGELPGRITDVPWAAIYPGETLARHPSSLYQAFLEGVVLFTLLWLYSAKPRPKMAVSGMFLMAYGTLRFISEFFRQPDNQMGFVAFNWMTQGQRLSIPMILFGLAFLIYAYRRRLS